jgi:hypothetical protein
MNPQDFLDAKNFTLSTHTTTKITPLDTKKLKVLTEVNTETIKFVASETLDAMLEASSISDKTDTPATPSYQPLNETGVLISGEALDKSLIGALTNNSLSIQEDAKEALNNTTKLSADIDSNMSVDTTQRMQEAQETLATGVKSLANSAEHANSGIKFAGGSVQFAGNNISMGSSTAVHMSSPIISTVADVENRQSKSIQETTNQKTTIAKSTFTQIEGLQTTIAANSMKSVTNTSVQVSTISSNTAIEKAITNSNQIENVAGNYIKNRSQNIISNEANSTISNQSPNISLTAAQGSKSSLGVKNEIGDENSKIERALDGSVTINAKDPSGKVVQFTNINPETAEIEKWKSVGGLEGQQKDKIAPVQKRQGGGNLSILADGDGGTVSIINKNMIMSSTGSQNVTVGGNLNQVAQGSLTTSAAFVNNEADFGLTMSGTGYIRSQQGTTGSFIAGGFTFAGYRFPALKKFIDKISNIPLQIREIPALSSLPLAIGVEDLSSCLPKKYKDTVNQNPDISVEDTEEIIAGKTPDELAAPTLKEAKQREKTAAIPVGKSTADAQGGLIQALEPANSKKVDGNTMLASNASPTDQTAVPKNKLTSAAAVFKGGSDVYTIDEEDPFDIYDRQGNQIIDPDASDETGGDLLLKDLISSISNLNINNTVSLLNSKPELINVIGTNIKAVRAYFYDKLIQDKTILEESTLTTANTTVNTFATPTTNSVEMSALPEYEYSKEYKKFMEETFKVPGAKEVIDRIELEIVSKASTGGVMSFISSAYTHVNSSISIASNIFDQVNNSNELAALKSTSQLAKNITGKEIFSDINKIIDSSSSISNIYNQVNNLINNENGAPSQITTKLAFETLANTMSESLNIIGIKNIEKATNLAQILSSIKNSAEYKRDGLSPSVKKQLLSLIVSEIGVNFSQAESLYNDAEDIISSILEGNITDLVEGSELENLLGYFIGESNAAVLTELKDVYLKGQGLFSSANNILDQGKDLYQDGRDLYSTIQSIPAMVGLMNEYEIPLLNQVKLVLQCSELITKVQDIVGGIREASKSIQKFGESVIDTFDAFNNLITEDKKPERSTLEIITGGLITGAIAPAIDTPKLIGGNFNNTNTIINTTINNTVVNSTSPLIEDIVTKQEPDPVIINNQQVTAQNCSTIIFSYGVDTKDSNNPSDWQEPISEIDAVEFIENLPRLTQIYNSIKEIQTNNISTILPELSPTQIENIKNSEIKNPPSNCFIAPKLNLIESSVFVIDIKDNIMLYKLKNLGALDYNYKNINIGNNTIVQIVAREFINTKTSTNMQVLRTKEFFSPYIYSFKTTVFDKEKNLGIAYLMNNQSRIYLQTNQGVPYNYSITDIGKKLSPIILDAYLVA